PSASCSAALANCAACFHQCCACCFIGASLGLAPRTNAHPTASPKNAMMLSVTSLPTFYLPSPLTEPPDQPERHYQKDNHGGNACLHHAAHGGSIIQPWEGLVFRHGHAQKVTEWFPALAHIVDQQPVGRYGLLHCFDVRLKDSHGMLPIFKVA